ncbi:hypothetical protein TNCV_1370651 [Trichonephila clavipes]|nr:hypothetical protein TNCV_1370651 [Trichonephila clavipes]
MVGCVALVCGWVDGRILPHIRKGNGYYQVELNRAVLLLTRKRKYNPTLQNVVRESLANCLLIREDRTYPPESLKPQNGQPR